MANPPGHADGPGETGSDIASGGGTAGSRAEPTVADDRHYRPDRPGHSSDRSFRAASSDEAGFWPVTSLQ
ncbi:hypothetical protein LZ190_19285, partial [Rhodovulum sulfidophilum]|nr:hypothetical protein [Rhodovulum sulfidophilum]